MFKLDVIRYNHANKENIPCFCIFHAPRGQKHFKDFNFLSSFSKNELLNIKLVVKGGPKFWTCYVEEFLKFARNNECAVALSKNVFDAISPEIPETADLFRFENPLMVGHGSCFRYCLLDYYKSCSFYDTDQSAKWCLNIKNKFDSILKSNPSIEYIRRNPALSPLGSKDFYRHTMGSGIFIKNIGIPIADFFEERAEQPNFYEKPVFWEKFPYYGYDEFVLGELYKKEYKNRGKTGILVREDYSKIFKNPLFKKEIYEKDIAETPFIYEV